MHLQGSTDASGQQSTSFAMPGITVFNFTIRSQRMSGGYHVDLFSVSRHPQTGRLEFSLFKAKVPEPLVTLPPITAEHLSAAISPPLAIEMVAQRQGITPAASNSGPDNSDHL